MGKQTKGKLNRLHDLLGEGLLAPTRWLEERGYSRALLSKYVASGWLSSPARGVFRRPGPPLKWQHVVASLQNLLGLPVHVGGLTALEVHGKGHFVRLGATQTVHLYSHAALPSWLLKLRLADEFVVHRRRLFAEDERQPKRPPADAVHETGRTTAPAGIALTQIPWGSYDWPLAWSTVERAYLELLDEITSAESIVHANLIMQGLTTLSPRRLKALLAACRSIKVKRLFFALAERNNHQWLKELDPQAFDLGKGKRQLAPGGKLHPKYLITLPEDLGDSH